MGRRRDRGRGGSRAQSRGRELGRVPLALACGVAGLAFGAFLDIYQWTLAARQDLPTYLAVSGSSLPYNLAHAIGNVGFCLLLGPLFIGALRRYRRRFEVSWPAPGRARATAAGGATAALGVAIAVTLTLAVAPERPAEAAASPASKAARWLAAAQNRDGGFGAGRGQSSSQLFTGWSALGLAAAGRNPRDVARRNGRSITAYVKRAGSIGDTGELERTILVLRAAGLSPRRFGGRNLVAELVRRRRDNGSWRGNVAPTAFGILALRAAGETRVVAAALGRLAGARAGRRRRLRAGARSRQRRGQHGGRAAGAGRGRQARWGAGAARGRLPARGAEPRRRLRPERWPRLQRAVDRLGGAGPRGRRRLGHRAAREPAALPDPPPAPRRAHRLLARQRPDPGVGHGAGAHSAAPPAVPAGSGAAAQGASGRDARAGLSVRRRQGANVRRRPRRRRVVRRRAGPPRRANASPSTVSSAPTAARSSRRDDPGGPPPEALAAAVGLALGGVWLGRRRLRGRSA